MKKRNTLFLLQEEMPLFDALPSEYRDGWETAPVQPQYEDPRDLVIRFKRFMPKNRAFLRLQESVKGGTSVEEVLRSAQDLKLSDLSYDEMVDLFFVMGSKILGGYIRYGLKNIASDDDVEAVMTLSLIRKSLFAANAQYPAHA